MTHSARAKFGKMSARAKKLLLLRIYMYAVASGNHKLLSMLKVKSSHKSRRKRRKGRKRRKSRRKGGRRRKGHKMHGAEKAAFLRRMAAGRRKRRG